MLCLLASPAAARADEVARWPPFVEKASARFDIPVAGGSSGRCVRESGERRTLAGRPIVGSAGAMGSMQWMPGTRTDMRAPLGLGPSPFAPRDNIHAGTFYLRLMYERFGFPGLFAAYDAGPARYASVLAGASRLPAETRAYLQRTPIEDSAKSDASLMRGSSMRSCSPFDARGRAIFFLRTAEGSGSAASSAR